MREPSEISGARGLAPFADSVQLPLRQSLVGPLSDAPLSALHLILKWGDCLLSLSERVPRLCSTPHRRVHQCSRKFALWEGWCLDYFCGLRPGLIKVHPALPRKFAENFSSDNRRQTGVRIAAEKRHCWAVGGQTLCGWPNDGSTLQERGECWEH